MTPADADKAAQILDALRGFMPCDPEDAHRAQVAIVARALAEAELRGIRKAATVNGSTPYPLLDVLRILCDVADHALDAHSCDHHGYEVWSEARHAGRECLRELTRLATIGGLLNDDAVARARREGAEEMRERAATLCYARGEGYELVAKRDRATGRPSTAQARAEAFFGASNGVRALPLTPETTNER